MYFKHNSKLRLSTFAFLITRCKQYQIGTWKM